MAVKIKNVSAVSGVCAAIYQLPAPVLLALTLAPVDYCVQHSGWLGNLDGMGETVGISHMIAILY